MLLQAEWFAEVAIITAIYGTWRYRIAVWESLSFCWQIPSLVTEG